jgi:hypothetical protein
VKISGTWRQVESFVEIFILIPHIFLILGDEFLEFEDNILSYPTLFSTFFSYFLLGGERK